MTSIHSNCLKVAFLLLVILNCISALAQSNKSTLQDPVYVDKEGVLRWKKDNKEATFFGVNYTVPFAYGYRSHNALGKNLEVAIDQDVYHMARLGFNAFRVHVWDTEISDSAGNLLNNEHLRLFDHLIYKLKERNIKILVTPIAFWGNGYPEKDEKTAGFSSIYNKEKAVTEERAFKAQENYLRQFFKHVNPYTGLTYQQDPDIIAAEINNEPKHTGPKPRATAYVNRMVEAVRGSGWSKPIYYNISESPTYADAVAKSDIDGVSFQWYPTGLVANRTLRGNYLTHVDKYSIPFDTIPAFHNKSKMVYEFDAGDIMQSVMYPAMARSFRSAGFQWATQFAYDPMATAFNNTEYQTHYLNLAYTPSKAISMLIASKVFQEVPRGKQFDQYPANTTFGPFKISYKDQLSEMNSLKEFYYSNATQSKPLNAAKLEHIAGVGSSTVISYSGTGAYFLDKLEHGIWRLEVMPDAILIRDPFAKTSPDKEVTRIHFSEQLMRLSLPDMGGEFSIRAINKDNPYSTSVNKGAFKIKPGTYLLLKKGKISNKIKTDQWVGNLKLDEFIAPTRSNDKIDVVHIPAKVVSSHTPHMLSAKVVGVSSGANVSLLLQNASGMYQTIPMVPTESYQYAGKIPETFLMPGEISYRILVQEKGQEPAVFPGNYRKDPWAWDYYHSDSWKTYIASEQSNLKLFDATHDRELFIYPNLWKPNERQLLSDKDPKQLSLRLIATEQSDESVMGFQYFIGDKLQERESELLEFKTLVIKARSNSSDTAKMRVALITEQATGFAGYLTLSPEFKEYRIKLHDLKPKPFMLLPRPYPGFHPFWFNKESNINMLLKDAEKIEIILDTKKGKPNGFDLESIWLEKQ